MERHRCKLCFRNFVNGRALGGHMRSHMMNLYAVKKASKMKEDEEEKQQQPFDQDFQSVHSYSSTSAPLSSFSEEDEDDDDEEEEVKGVFSGYGSRENPKKNGFLLDSVLVQDRESETESFKNNPIRRRSKRVMNRFFSINDSVPIKKPKFNPNETEPEQLSSISETSPEEDVAHCLIMLSKDKWEREETEEFQFLVEKDGEKKSEDGYSEDSGFAKVIKSNNNNNKGKYRCETCNKFFRSYQALGGHRASHKKITKVNTDEMTAATPVTMAAEEKIHECPFCHRVFTSGQALGGHKRSHFLGGGGISANASPVIIDDNNIINNSCGNNNIPVKMEKVSRIGEGLNIDLNLPAPIDEDDEIAISAVSDAEFVNPMKQ